jgi:cell division protein FtsB
LKFDNNKEDLRFNFNPSNPKKPTDINSVLVDFTDTDNISDVDDFATEIEKNIMKKIDSKFENLNLKITSLNDEITILKKDNKILKIENKSLKDDNLSLKNIVSSLLNMSETGCIEIFNIVFEKYIQKAKKELGISKINDKDYMLIKHWLEYNYVKINWEKIFKLRDKRNKITHREPINISKVKDAMAIYLKNNWPHLESFYELSQYWLSNGINPSI